MIIKPFTKRYGSFLLTVPELILEPGKIYAIIGSNGCGKTTFGRVVSGIITCGERRKVTDAVTGYMPQKSFAFRMSVRKNVLLGAASPERAGEMIDRLGLSGLSEKNAKLLSGGETQRMALARILSGKYDLIILDEPTSAMDIESTLRAEDCIRGYAGGGSAVILITHSIKEAERTADEILYFESGRLVEKGTVRDVLSAPSDERTRRFLDFYGLRQQDADGMIMG